MAPPPQRRNATHSRPSAPTPMSERQQMALLMQMTSSTTEAELSPNSQSNKVKDRNERGETPLHIAAKKGDLEGAKKLLEQGSNPNVTDFAGWTPLHEAANHGHYHLAQLLIKFGANVMATGLDDMTPLHDAASFGNQKLVKMLIEKGADPLFKNKKGKTAQDIAHPSLVNFFRSTIDILNKQKKTTSGDLKKSADNEDTGTGASTSSAPSDIYEFVSTPKHSSCSSGDENPIKSFEKSSDEKSGTDSDTPTMTAASLNVQQKRALSDQIDRNDGTSSPTDEDSKRKKRKDSDFAAKDVVNKTSGPSTGTNRLGSRIIGQKIPGPASKTLGLMNKSSGNIERKSPCESPNIQTTKSPEVETDNDDSKNGEGPKVPPLKIVIPQQQSSAGPSNETQEGTQNSNLRTNKTTITRNVSGLPYIITTANESSNTSNEKEAISAATSVTTRGQSPSVDSNKSSDDTKPSCKSKESRILRSSQRSGKDSKDDRSSNNSSPQLPASSTPSPAAQNTDSSSTIGNGNDSEGHHLGQTVQISSVQTSVSSTSTIAQTSSSSLQTSSANNNNQQSTQSQQQSQGTSTGSTSSVELHPRKRKIKASSKESSQNSSASSTSSSSSSSNADVKDNNSKDGQEKSNEPVHPHDQPFANCYQMYIDLRKQIEQRHRNLHPIEPRPLKGLEDYLMNRRTYSLQGKTPTEPNIIIPPLLPTQMKDTFVEQEKERHRLKMKHIVEKEKLVLSKEQEILRVHCKAAQMQANQPQPFSVCTILKDEEVYNPITPEQEERYNNRSFFKELKDLDDKWDKIKEAIIIRHTNEAESLHAVQKMDWGWKLKEMALCDYKATPEIEELHVPMVDVSDEYTTPSIKN
ncbi:ankyrin repeat domain-containing protein 11-like [Chironomus tepperi]|uniref:ankyrin repeat domain-containing protein 11-like n=1 Tax=Chironomus tepperi TaxID=113505 RepID=UPI00391F63E5